MRRTLAALALAVVLPLPAPAGQIVVQPGETLSEIAERHQISVSRLMQINGLSNADHVEAGMRLNVPGATSATSGRSGGGGSRITVRDGETLSQIAEHHGISMARLMQINGITDPDLVESGRTLVISTATARASTAAAAPASYRRGAREHIVRPGESLSRIAEGYGLPMGKLVAINGISNPDRVEAGTRLRLRSLPPLPASSSSRPQASTAKPASSSPAAIAATSAPRPKPRSSAAPQPAAAVQPADNASTIATATAAASSEALAAGTTSESSATTSQPSAQAQPQPRPQPAVKPAPRPLATTAVSRPVTTVATASKPASTQSGARPGKPASPDWRSYGPLQVDWANWQPMGGSMVTPSLNTEGQSLYLAINCGARKLNATTATGQWKTWDDPRADFEQQIVNDLCKART
ncbi:MAG: LysM peptidoglycan-binding domain-containing protein [Synechococcaceae cyanobacterium]|nr:LysM peptidoglycan-binding domain-containing protein [Synechococcaceae cyanobacterium]